MIPKRLTIEGLYSYQERQIIDFDNLTSAGLFGIFGATGSGKSTILEAISYALYGETERMNSREKRSYNMMNLKSNQFYIDFEFLNHDENLYRIVREFKRNNKKFEDVKVATPILYAFKNQAWIPLEHSDVSQLLGLSYDNFKRTIIIPQGQFKEFLELGASGRTRMMNEIFGLQRFDLQNQTFKLVSQTNSDFDRLQGQLLEYGQVSAEQLAQLALNLKQFKNEEEKYQKSFTEIDKEFKQLSDFRLSKQSLQTHKNQYQQLEVQSPVFEKLEKQISQYEEALLNFSPLLKEEKQLSDDLKLNKNNAEIKSKAVALLKEKLEIAANQFEKLKISFEKIDSQKQELADLQIILNLTELSETLINNNKRLDSGKQFIEKEKSKSKDAKKTMINLLSEMEDLKKQKLDSTILLDLSTWYQQQREQAKQLSEKEENLLKIKLDIDKEKEKLLTLGVHIGTFEQDYNTRLIEIKDKENEYNRQLNHLKVQQKLGEFADTLHEDTACPLCGSIQHPHILSTEDVSVEIHQILLNLKKLEKDKEELLDFFKKSQQLLSSLQSKQSIYNDEQKNRAHLTDKKKNHLETFKWAGFDPQNEIEFIRQKDQSVAVEKQLQVNETARNNQQKTIDEHQRNIEKFEKELQKIENDTASIQGSISTQKNTLKILNYIDYQTTTSDSLKQKIDKLSFSIVQLEQDYKQTELEINKLNLQMVAANTDLSGLERMIKSLEEKSAMNLKQFTEQLAQSKFANKEQIIEILKLNFNLANEKHKLQQFKIDKATLSNHIADLELKLKDIDLGDERFETMKTTWEAADTRLKTSKEQVRDTQKELNELQADFIKKEKLLKEFDKIQNRSKNLRILSNLFKGAGFVEFVSAIYLRQLCDHANVRFHRMTRNQLSLQLSDNLDFEVIDYLNEGRSRSVNTLSGGQSFQVSLALALALAESVQSNAKAKRNFFFIDEGFGTQDTESVNVVFETLLQLNKENKIVGIISHVDELKERIPSSLMIVLDKDRGSLIVN